MLYQRLTSLLPLALLFVGLTVAGCDSNDGDDAPSIGGTYTATQTDDGDVSTIEITFPDVTGGSFNASGTVSGMVEGVTVSFPLTASGTYDFPNISMNVTVTIAGETDSESVSGTVSNSADIMTLTDSEGDTFTFRRQ